MDILDWRRVSKSKPQGQGFSPIQQGKGAYVNVVACVESKAAFEERVKRHVEGIECTLVELEHVQLLEARMSEEHYPEELIDMRQTATRQQADTVFGTFHIWCQEESN
jgi:hypothetical protein